MTIEIETKPESNKPGYDIRIGYVRELSDQMKMVRAWSNQVAPNLSGWWSALRTYYDMSHSYIPKKEADELDKKLETILKKITNATKVNKRSSAIMRSQLKLEMHRLTSEIYRATKHLLLPIKQQDDADFEDESFFRAIE